MTRVLNKLTNAISLELDLAKRDDQLYKGFHYHFCIEGLCKNNTCLSRIDCTSFKPMTPTNTSRVWLDCHHYERERKQLPMRLFCLAKLLHHGRYKVKVKNFIFRSLLLCLIDQSEVVILIKMKSESEKLKWHFIFRPLLLCLIDQIEVVAILIKMLFSCSCS